jgi:2',3'-cyclic-nucleotide 2'-phosphodiesterase (5'-nucleotidase family)
MLKKILFTSILCLLFTTASLSSAFAVENTPKFHCPAPQTCVNFVAINDVYEWKPYPTEKTGSLSRLSTYLTRLHERFPQTDVLFAGDLLSPSSDSQLTKGLHMVQGLNALGIKVATLGNHEFDFGEQGLANALKASQFPWLAANVQILPNTTLSPSQIKPYTILEQAGKRILVFGLLTTETTQLNTIASYITIKDPIETAKTLLPQWIKAEKPDAVIALTHLNIAEDRRLAQSVPNIDVILGGHDHHQLLQVINGVPIIKLDSDARTVGHLQLNFHPMSALYKRSKIKLSPIAEWHYEVTALTPADFPEDKAFEAKVLEKTPARLASLDEPVGTLPVTWNVNQDTIRGVYSPTAQQIAEILRRYLKTDVVILNSGGIRGNRIITPSLLTQRDILQILPFDNAMVTLTLSKAQLQAVLEKGFSQVDTEPNWGGYLHFSGVVAVVNPKVPVGKRVQAVLDARTGLPLDASRSFRVSVNTYLAEGGNGFEMFKQYKDAQVPAPVALTETQAVSLGKALKALTPQALHDATHQAPSVQVLLQAL